MDTTETQADNQSRNYLSAAAPLADTLSKSVAAIAIAIYACGFLVISLHHSRYGFSSTNPFRPRIFAAGTWFLFFSAIPVSLAMWYRKRTWRDIAESLLFVTFIFIGIGNSVFYVLEVSPTSGPISDIRWWFWLWAVGIAIGLLLYIFAKSRKTPTILLPVASVATVLFFVALEINGAIVGNDFKPFSLQAWFMGVFVSTLFVIKGNPEPMSERLKLMGMYLNLLFLTVFVFAHYYYPRMKASWGGGAPIGVTLYFTKDSAIKANQAVAVQLIEESDEGFYIVAPKESKAIYVPRSSVALVYFSDNIASSELLRKP